MTKFPYLKYFCVFSILYLFCHSFLFAQSALIGKDAPENFKWLPASEDQISYALLSLDGKERTFFVDTGTFFAPVKASARRDLYTKYTSKPAKTLKFYTRKQEGKQVFFSEIFSADIENLKDFILVISETGDGKILVKAVDISLSKMPLSSLSVVNLSPYNLGLSADKSFAKLNPFESFCKKVSSDTEEIKACTLRMYDLRNAKSPRLLLTKTYSFWTSKRIVVFFFELPRMENGSERPASLVMYDRGPR